jgi:C4-dicarboxylate-specific signal transduction histidine kinase
VDPTKDLERPGRPDGGDWEGLCRGALAFFGRTTASATHEIKNHLSTLKEQAGLIADLINLAHRGRELNLERIETLVKRINDRVDSTDAILRQLNGFAHSVDEPLAEVDLGEVLAATVRLSRRLAALKGVELDCRTEAGPAWLATRPFFLRQALALCLEVVLAAAAEGGRVEARLEPDPAGARCVFIPDPCAGAAELPGPAGAVLEALGARVDPGPLAGALLLTFARPRPGEGG